MVIGLLQKGWKGWKGWAWPAISAVVTAGATIASGMLSADSLEKFQNKSDVPANVAARSAEPFWAWVTDHRTWVIGVLVLIAVVPTVWSVIYTKKVRDDARLDMMKRYLRLASKRSFPEADGFGGFGTRARVSLFVPEGKGEKRELHCVYRTDQTTPKRSWPVIGNVGFVVRAWREQTTRTVHELTPELQKQPNERERYHTEAWSNEEIMKTLSWPGAAMIAVPITVRPGADPDAVFLVEAFGIALEQQVHEWDASMCCMLLEDHK